MTDNNFKATDFTGVTHAFYLNCLLFPVCKNPQSLSGTFFINWRSIHFTSFQMIESIILRVLVNLFRDKNVTADSFTLMRHFFPKYIA